MYTIKTTTFVSDCSTVKDFMQRYHKYWERDLANWGKDEMQRRIEEREKEIQEKGSTTIVRGCTTVGHSVSFSPNAGILSHHNLVTKPRKVYEN